MQTKKGKTLTIFIVLIIVLLFSSAAIGFFMYQKESQKRKDVEIELQDAQQVSKKLTDDLKDAKSQLVLLQDKNKEADKKINSLMDEMELNEGLRNESKKENSALKDSVEVAKKEKDSIRADLDMVAKKLLENEGLLKAEQVKTKDLLAKVNELEIAKKKSEVNASASTLGQMELGKIVVEQDLNSKGRVLSVDKESEFVICNLGVKQGIKMGDVLSVYREDKYIGDLRVSRAQEEMSAADFIPPLSSRNVHKNDIVVLKQS